MLAATFWKIQHLADATFGKFQILPATLARFKILTEDLENSRSCGQDLENIKSYHQNLENVKFRLQEWKIQDPDRKIKMWKISRSFQKITLT